MTVYLLAVVTPRGTVLSCGVYATRTRAQAAAVAATGCDLSWRERAPGKWEVERWAESADRYVITAEDVIS